MQHYSISDDGGRTVRFEGELLGSASTRERDSIRWTETNLYRTKAGKFILQKVGRSLVFHSVDGCKYGQWRQLGDVSESSQPCPVCKPQEFDETYSVKVKLETDRFSVHVSDTADGIVESAKLQDDDGVWYTPRVARDALEQAAENDTALHEAYMTTVVD